MADQSIAWRLTPTSPYMKSKTRAFPARSVHLDSRAKTALFMARWVGCVQYLPVILWYFCGLRIRSIVVVFAIVHQALSHQTGMVANFFTR